MKKIIALLLACMMTRCLHRVRRQDRTRSSRAGCFQRTCRSRNRSG